MTTETKKPEVKKPEKVVEKKKSIWSSEEVKKLNELYGTDILVENGSHEELTTTQAPNDAWIIKYTVDDKTLLDLSRGTKTKLFDMYYDKFKQGLKDIQYGNGNISPKLWGHRAKQATKKKRRKT